MLFHLYLILFSVVTVYRFFATVIGRDVFYYRAISFRSPCTFFAYLFFIKQYFFSSFYLAKYRNSCSLLFTVCSSNLPNMFGIGLFYFFDFIKSRTVICFSFIFFFSLGAYVAIIIYPLPILSVIVTFRLWI